MSQQPSVPRLDLTPKLKRPLSLWNPLDYLRLLYWVFFFPQALRWYVDRFGGWYIPEEEMNWQKVWEWLRQNPIQRQLLFQGLIVKVATLLNLSLILQTVNVPFDWFGVVFGVGVGLAVGLGVNVAVGVAVGVAFGVVVNVVGGVVFGLGGLTGGITASVAAGVGGLTSGVAFGVAVNVAFGVFGGLAFEVFGGVAFGVAFGVYVGVAFGVFGGVALEATVGLAKGTVVGVVVGVGVGVVGSLAVLRPDMWLIGSLLNLRIVQNGSRFFPRITPLPLPYLDLRLQNWLQQNWEIGLHNTNQFLAYTLQFIPVVQAVNRVLATTSSDQIIWRISRLAEAPFDWKLILFASVPLDEYLKLELIEAFFIFPYSWQYRLRASLLLDTRLDTPARATAAGFWYLHEKQPAKAMEAFIVVRSLLYGEEMYILAQTLATFYKAKQLAAVATLEVPAFPQEPFLRPNVWNALISLRQVVEDVQLLERSLSGIAKSLAFSHSLGKLTNILNTADTLPQAERGLIIDIAQTWKDCLLQIAGEIGEISITQPVTNPYVIGDPVQDTLFVGREDVIAQLKELWVNSHQLQSVVLYGHRRMGKTSILLNAAQCLESGIQLAYVNLLRLGDSPQGVGEVLIAISDEISQVVKLPPPTDADLLNLPYRNFERYLKQITTQLKDGLIIALDEFEKIEDLIDAGKIPQDFMGYLRGLVQMSPKVAFALAGLHTLEEMTADYFQPFFASVIPIHVGFMRRAATRQILANPGEDFPLDCTPEALDEIYVLTHGQPYLVQLVGFQLVRRYNDFVFEQGHSRDPVFTVEDVEAVINDPEFFKRGSYYFDGVWGQAARGAGGQQAILQVLAPYPEGLNLDALAHSTGLGRENIQSALHALMRHDVVEEIEGNYRIIVELFRRWILRE
ncbi:ATP-binding protein [Nostoc sp. ChiSLP03a]|uniref:AAA family ATPase n=1 Tax=Nostoc sp. ChiSLP03a TaxID=3075380 RepID=UPI002AD5AFE9|nr:MULTISPECIES: ATP-binding protein [Nostocaceae]MDZ8208238.1 ATP-binding protein [Dendronalium sp. ChiSLP03b]MDZ8212521.1 ATP-binding protein [Nostoc sp. ChiSLP03a]